MIDTFPTPPTGNGAAAPARPDRFRLWTVEEICNREPPPWLVGSAATFGILPEAQLTVLFGTSGHGKTFIALDLAFCVATGTPWHRFPVKQGAVVYVAAEGAHSLSVRVPALMKHYGIEESPENLRFVISAMQFMNDPEDPDSDLARLVTEIQAQGVEPVLIVIDTLARSMLGGDENTAKDMGTVVENADRLKTTMNAAVLIVHHSGKGGEMRGSTALLGAVDKQISAEAVEVNDQTIVTVKSTKTKDGPDFKDMHFRLMTIPLPEKGPGEKSAVLVPCPPPPTKSRGGKREGSHKKPAAKKASEDQEAHEKQIVIQAFRTLGPNAIRADAEKLCTQPNDEGRPTISAYKFNKYIDVLSGDDETFPLRRTGTPGKKGKDGVRYTVADVDDEGFTEAEFS